jgi:hypothetical protein
MAMMTASATNGCRAIRLIPSGIQKAGR